MVAADLTNDSAWSQIHPPMRPCGQSPLRRVGQRRRTTRPRRFFPAAGPPNTAPKPSTRSTISDDDERTPLGRRAKIALLIGAVAAVVVIGLVVGYAVLVGKQPQTQPDVSPSGRHWESGAWSERNGGLLTDDLMLSPSQAKVLDRSRAWKVDETELRRKQDVSTPACFGGEPAEGQPPPQQEIVRVLSSTGKNAPHAVHAATAYSSNAEASAAYAVAAKTLGSCGVAGSWIESGHLGQPCRRPSRWRRREGGARQKDRGAQHRPQPHLARIMNVIDAVHPIGCDSHSRGRQSSRTGQPQAVCCSRRRVQQRSLGKGRPAANRWRRTELLYQR
mgnify:CR=1 FL=1